MFNHLFNTFLIRLGKNFFWLSISHLCGLILSFVGTLYLARILEPDGFGKIGYAFGITAFFMQVANMGITVLGTRDLAQNSGTYENNVNSVISFRIIQSFLSFTLLLLIFFVFPISIKNIRFLVLFYGISLLFSPFDLKWFFQGIEKMQYITLLNVSGQLAYVFLLYLFVKDKKNLMLVPALYVIAQFLLPGIIGIAILSSLFRFPRLSFNLPAWRKNLSKVFPIGVSSIIGEVYYIFDVVLINHIRGATEVGYYNAATKVVFIVNAVAGIYASAVFPQLAASIRDSLESFSAKLTQIMKISLIASVILAFSGKFTASHVIHLLYGKNYGDSVIVLQILLWMSAVYWVAIILLNALVVMNLQNKQLLIVSTGVITNMILNLFLIPSLGIIGASIASFSGFFIIFLLAYFHVRKAFF